jgi:hypothetical protein
MSPNIVTPTVATGEWVVSLPSSGFNTVSGAIAFAAFRIVTTADEVVTEVGSALRTRFSQPGYFPLSSFAYFSTASPTTLRLQVRIMVSTGAPVSVENTIVVSTESPTPKLFLNRLPNDAEAFSTPAANTDVSATVAPVGTSFGSYVEFSTPVVSQGLSRDKAWLVVVYTSQFANANGPTCATRFKLVTNESTNLVELSRGVNCGPGGAGYYGVVALAAVLPRVEGGGNGVQVSLQASALAGTTAPTFALTLSAGTPTPLPTPSPVPRVTAVSIEGTVTQSEGSASEAYEISSPFAWSAWTTIEGWTTSIVPSGFYLTIAQGAIVMSQLTGSGGARMRIRLRSNSTVLSELGETCGVGIDCPYYLSSPFTSTGVANLFVQVSIIQFGTGSILVTIPSTSFTSPRIIAVRMAN